MKARNIVLLDAENGRVIFDKLLYGDKVDITEEVHTLAEKHDITSDFDWMEFSVVEEWR